MTKFTFRLADLDDMPLLLDMKAAYHASEGLPFDHELERDSLLQLLRDPEKGAVLLIHWNGEDAGYCILLFGVDPASGRNAIMDELYGRYSLDVPDLMNSIRQSVAQICREHGIRVFHERFGHQSYLKTRWLA